MITLIVLGIAATVVVVLFAAMFAGERAPRRENENRFAASGDVGFVPWIDAGGVSSDCTSDAGGVDAGCSDGGGGGGGD